MATLDIEGRRVDVDDSFLKLSPQQQNETVMHIAASLQASGHLPGAKPQRQVVSQPTYDPMGNATGGTEDVPAFEQSRSPVVAQSDDILKGAAGGVVRGVAGIVGFPAMAADYLTRGSDYLAQKLTGQSDEDYRAQEKRRKDARLFPGAMEAIKPEGIQRGIESVTGPAYVPTTRAGRFASAATEFGVGGAVGRPANIARNIIAYGVVPGLLSEAGGQAFEGSAAETPARIAGALAGGVGGALATRGGTAGSMIRSAVDGATPQQLDAAEQLFQRAAQAGTPISRAEAIQAVSQGSTRIGDLQHTIEGMGGMKEFYSQRPAQNEAAARRAFDTLSPPLANPSQVGPQVGQAAEGVVGDVTQAINRRTRPLYQAAETQRVGPQVQQALVADPLYAQTLQEVRTNPALNRTIENLPDDSVGVIDLVQRRMREQADNARLPGQANTSNLAAANFDDARTVPLAAADTVTGSRPATVSNPPVAGSYETARNAQQQLRQQYLEPLMNGPIGKLAGRDTTTKNAIGALGAWVRIHETGANEAPKFRASIRPARGGSHVNG